MTQNITYSIIQFGEAFEPGDREMLVDLILDAIHTQNSVGFLLTTTREELMDFWATEMEDSANTVLLARDHNQIIGVIIMTRETRPNGRHRAELRKLMVHSTYQRQGIGKELITRAEEFARTLALSLLYLDSATDFLVQRVYESWGWQKAGSIPDYSSKPDGTLEPTTYFYKLL